jgi:hypothetical protein
MGVVAPAGSVHETFATVETRSMRANAEDVILMRATRAEDLLFLRPFHHTVS